MDDLARFAGHPPRRSSERAAGSMTQHRAPEIAEDSELVDDWALVEQVRRGDAGAFSVLFRRHHARIRTDLRLRLPDAAVADELASEVFVRAWRSIGVLSRDRSSLLPWLRTVASNLARDYWKHSQRREVCFELPVDFGRLLFEPHDVESAEQQVLHAFDSDTLRLRLRRAFDVLTDDQRRCVYLRFALDQSLADTARALDRSKDAAKMLQYRALLALREVLEES